MKFLFDLFPVIFLFGMFKWGEGHPEAAQAILSQYFSGFISGGVAPLNQAPIILATAAAIIATIGQVAYQFLQKRKIDTMLWLSFFIIVIFGGATIYFHNETFIKWKPTVLYWCFGAALLFSQFIMKKNMIRTMLEEQIKLPEPVWTRLSLAWVAFFLSMGLINLYVAFNFSTSNWVSFKLYGFTGLMLVFILGQTFFLSKHMPEQK
jgi:intracellular septation protein